mmetsp:Transcript_7912/g.13651  ORF Transcript_7912/g.13651 Transcript_7912/m.13651 type:complete len:104 (+) Transcript_7912:921-1232(+)
MGFTSGETRHYLDVFRKGRLLDSEDCRHIASSYGFAWKKDFLKPLEPAQVFTRILNNLSNCHNRGQPDRSYRDTLSFQERIVHLMHQQPHIASHLLQTTGTNV